jgi:anti-anti-sigma factor
MFVHHETHDAMQVFRPVGRLDSATSGELEALLVEQLDAGCNGIVLDLADLDYISSAGLRVILMTGKRLRAAGGRLVLARMRDSVRDLFEMSGFLGWFPLADSVEQALA